MNFEHHSDIRFLPGQDKIAALKTLSENLLNHYRNFFFVLAANLSQFPSISTH